MMHIPFIKPITWYLVMLMIVLGMAPKVDASYLPSAGIAPSAADRDSDLTKIQATLEEKIVRDRLEKLGLTADEINTRLSQLDDQQVHSLALHLDRLQAGGEVLGVIIGLLIIAILVVVLIQLTGHKIIVK